MEDTKAIDQLHVAELDRVFDRFTYIGRSLRDQLLEDRVQALLIVILHVFLELFFFDLLDFPEYPIHVALATLSLLHSFVLIGHCCLS